MEQQGVGALPGMPKKQIGADETLFEDLQVRIPLGMASEQFKKANSAETAVGSHLESVRAVAMFKCATRADNEAVDVLVPPIA
jgi:hypothetical protein